MTKDGAPEYSALPMYVDELDPSTSTTPADPWIETTASAPLLTSDCSDHSSAPHSIPITDPEPVEESDAAAAEETPPHSPSPPSPPPVQQESQRESRRQYRRRSTHGRPVSAWIERSFPALVQAIAPLHLQIAAFLFMVPFLHVSIAMYTHNSWENSIHQTSKLLTIFIIYLSTFGCISAALAEWRFYLPVFLLDVDVCYFLWMANTPKVEADSKDTIDSLSFVGTLLFLLNFLSIVTAAATAFMVANDL